MDTTSKNKILLVDQPSVELQQLAQILRQSHFEPQLCTNSEEAFSFCLQTPPHLLVCDYSMQPFSGPDLAQKLKNNIATRAIPFILLSKPVELEEKLRLMDLEIDDYVTKPFNPDEMAARIETIFQESEAKRHSEDSLKSGFGGSLQEMSLIDLIQTLELGEKSAIITLRRGQSEGNVFIHQGVVVDAEYGGLDGEKALEQFMGWLYGHFCLTFVAVQRPRKIHKLNRELFQTGLGLMEHGRQLMQQLPPLHTLLTPDKSVKSNGLSGDENRLLASIRKPMTLHEIIMAGTLAEMETLLILKALIEKQALHYNEQPAGEKPVSPIEHEIVDKVLRARRKNKNSLSLITSFFKREKNGKFLDQVLVEQTTKTESDDTGFPPARHLLYLQRSDLLLIKQKLAN